MLSFVFLFLRSVGLALLFVVLLLLVMLMPLWSQNSDWNLNDSNDTLLNWNALFEEGQTHLEAQSKQLDFLRKELETSKTGYEESIRLLEPLYASNKNLTRFNEEIAERMQERDQDLYQAYQRIDRLERRNLQHWIAHVVMGGVIGLFLILLLRRKRRLI